MRQRFLDVSDGCNGSLSVLLMQLSHALAASCRERLLRWQLSRNHGTTSTSSCSTIITNDAITFRGRKRCVAAARLESVTLSHPATTC